MKKLNILIGALLGLVAIAPAHAHQSDSKHQHLIINTNGKLDLPNHTGDAKPDLNILDLINKPNPGKPGKLMLPLPFGAEVDIGPAIKQITKTRASYIYAWDNAKGLEGLREHHLGIHYPVGLLHTKKKKEVINLNLGLAYDLKGVGGGFASLGFRADHIGAYIAERGWFKEHLTLNLPAVEIGPFGGWMQHKGWIYGIFVGKPLGKGGADPEES